MQVQNWLQKIRKERGLAASDLAERAGISRQTIYAIEDGSFVPNTAIALRLARVLDSTVENLFSLDDQNKVELAEAEPVAGDTESDNNSRFVTLCRVNERLIAAPVSRQPAYLPVSDGVVAARRGRKLLIKSTVDKQGSRPRLLLAGCDPALSMLAAALLPSAIEVITVQCSSRRALEWLKQGRVHVAGSHLRHSATGEFNVPIVSGIFRANVRVINFASWRQGLLVRAGNPKSIRGVGDLARKDVRVVNREKGSGSRDLLDRELRKEKIRQETVSGYDRVAEGHLVAASDVAAGLADCCVAAESAARLYELDFIPLETERFDLTFPNTTLELPAAKALLDTLQRASLRRKLHTLAGYDTAHTGDAVM
jgi:putative molybdopterin biosynthesis protein